MFEKLQGSKTESPIDLIGPSIKNALSFEDLEEKIKKIGTVSGSRQEFQPDFLINIISKVRNYESGFGIERITSEGGLRDKVWELMQNELGEGLSLQDSILYAESLEDLRDILASSEGIQGSGKLYSAEDLTKQVQDIINGDDSKIYMITNELGLRNKIVQLRKNL